MSIFSLIGSVIQSIVRRQISNVFLFVIQLVNSMSSLLAEYLCELVGLSMFSSFMLLMFLCELLYFSCLGCEVFFIIGFGSYPEFCTRTSEGQRVAIHAKGNVFGFFR